MYTVEISAVSIVGVIDLYLESSTSIIMYTILYPWLQHSIKAPLIEPRYVKRFLYWTPIVLYIYQHWSKIRNSDIYHARMTEGDYPRDKISHEVVYDF